MRHSIRSSPIGYLLTAAAAVTFLSVPKVSEAVEVGVFAGGGRLAAVIQDGTRIRVAAGFVVRLEGGREVEIQPREQGPTSGRAVDSLFWKGISTLPNGLALDYEVSWTEQPGALRFAGKLQYAGGRRAMIIESIDYVVDLPRDLFVGGLLEFANDTSDSPRVSRPVSLDSAGQPGIVFSGSSGGSLFTDAQRNWKIGVTLDKNRQFFVSDRLAPDTRSYRVRIALLEGNRQVDTTADISLSLTIAGKAAAAPARLIVESGKPIYRFAGFGRAPGEQALKPHARRDVGDDSFDYGLRELEKIQNFLRNAQPGSSQYWPFAEGQGLTWDSADAKSEPLKSSWMMKQMVDLTPAKSQAVASASDQPEVLVSAFESNAQTVVHVLNMGPSRKAVLSGLPGKVSAWLTTEIDGTQKEAGVDPATLTLQPRSLTTLISGGTK